MTCKMDYGWVDLHDCMRALVVGGIIQAFAFPTNFPAQLLQDVRLYRNIAQRCVTGAARTNEDGLLSIATAL